MATPSEHGGASLTSALLDPGELDLDAELGRRSIDEERPSARTVSGTSFVSLLQERGSPSVLYGAPSMCSESRLHPGPYAFPREGLMPTIPTEPELRLNTSSCNSFLKQFPAIVVAVLMTGINGVTYGTLVFRTGSLLTGASLPNGVFLWIMATAMGQVGVSSVSRLACGIGAATVEMLPIVHSIFQGLAVSLGEGSAEVDPNALLQTGLAVLFLATSSLGVVLAVGGYLGFSRYLRAFPLVVLKGALFGVGIFLLQSAIDMNTVGSLWDDWWYPAVPVVLGSLLFVFDEALHSPVVVCMFLVIVASTPTLLQLAGVVTLEELRQKEWLFVVEQNDQMTWYDQLSSFHPLLLPEARWDVAFRQVPAIAGLWLTHVLCTLMDLKCIEVLTRQEVNLDSELQAVGCGNVLSALSGVSWPIYIVVSMNMTVYKLGGRSRIVGIIVLASTIPILFAVQIVVPCLPKALPGCATWWLGMAFLKETIVDITREHAHKTDIIIVVSMAMVIVFVDFLYGLLFGFMLAVLAFLFQYASSPANIRAISDATYFRSNVGRSLSQHGLLERLGGRIAVIHIDGYLMFGSVPQLVDAMGALLLPEGPPWILMNLRGVTGLDYSAVLDLLSLGRRASANKQCIVLTELRGVVSATLRQLGVEIPRLPQSIVEHGESIVYPFGDLPGLVHVPDYQQGLMACEDMLLASMGLTTEIPDGKAMLALSFADYLDDDTQQVEEMYSYFEDVEYAPGEIIWRSGEPSEFMIGVVRGSLHALQQPASSEADPYLLEVVQAGAFVGYSGVLNGVPYMVTVVVPQDSEPCACLKLKLEGFHKMSAERPRLAIALLRCFVRRSAYEWRDLARLAAQA